MFQTLDSFEQSLLKSIDFIVEAFGERVHTGCQIFFQIVDSFSKIINSLSEIVDALVVRPDGD